jgi:hypothetical protein
VFIRLVIRWGVALGISVGIWTLVLHGLGLYTTRIRAGQVADVLASVLPVAFVACALRERRSARARGLRFRESAGTGLGVGIVAAPISATFLWWYHHYLNPHWLDHLVAWKAETMAAAGDSPTAIAATVDSLRASGTDQAQVIGGIAGTIVVTTAIGALMHLYFRRRPSG